VRRCATVLATAVASFIAGTVVDDAGGSSLLLLRALRVGGPSFAYASSADARELRAWLESHGRTVDEQPSSSSPSSSMSGGFPTTTTLNEKKRLDVGANSDYVSADDDVVVVDGNDDDDDDDDDDDSDDDDDDEPVFRSDDDSDDDAGDIITGTYETCDSCESCALGDAPDGVVLNAPERGTSPARVNGSGGVKCKQCYGCNVVLERMKAQVTFRKKEVKVQFGASGAVVLKGRVLEDDNSTKIKPVIAKLWCGLKGGYKHLLNVADNPAPSPEQCKDEVTQHPVFDSKVQCQRTGMLTNSFCNAALLLAIDKIADESGLATLIPRVKKINSKTFTPMDGSSSAGVKQDASMLVFDVAPGVSFESLQSQINGETLAMVNKIDPERIKLLALFDFITGQGDRHAQNVFITEDGYITGIDNESAFRRELNSMLIPGGQKHETYRVGYQVTVCALRNDCNTVKSTPSTLGLLLDYRCFVKGRYMGKDLPEALKPFLERVNAMTTEEVYDHFMFANSDHAEVFKERVKDLYELGFEGAVKKAYSQMPSGSGTFGSFQYDVPESCCTPSECSLSATRDIVNSTDACVGLCDKNVDARARAFVGPNTEESLETFLKFLDDSPAEASFAPSQSEKTSRSPPTTTNESGTIQSPSPSTQNAQFSASEIRAKIAELKSNLFQLRRAEYELRRDRSNADADGDRSNTNTPRRAG